MKGILESNRQLLQSLGCVLWDSGEVNTIHTTRGIRDITIYLHHDTLKSTRKVYLGGSHILPFSISQKASSKRKVDIPISGLASDR